MTRAGECGARDRPGMGHAVTWEELVADAGSSHPASPLRVLWPLPVTFCVDTAAELRVWRSLAQGTRWRGSARSLGSAGSWGGVGGWGA